MASDMPRTFDTKDVESPFDVQLTIGAGLDVAPAGHQPKRTFKDFRSLGESLTWNWTLAPKSPGRHKILVQGLPVTSYMVRPQLRENAAQDLGRMPKPSGNERTLPGFIKVLPDKTVDITIETLTPIGLTARQDAYAKAAQGLAAFIGGILAYPFLKRFFESDDKSADKRRRAGFRT